MEPEVQPKMLSDTELIELVDEVVRRYVVSRGCDSLEDAIHYAVFGGGKRIRPLLCLRACEAVGGDIEKALPVAAAVELIHTFSLVHDDLPAMDDDGLRRGRPTLHKHTNEAMAILAGDAMTALAFGLITHEVQDPAIAAECVGRLASATYAMITGQVYDTMGGQPEKLEQIQQLQMTHGLKTGALLGASIQMGAVVGGADEPHHEALEAYAHALGLMFQAVDDLLDVTQTADKMGKATHKDAEQGKLTYPSLLGIDGTRAEIEKLRKRAIDALSGFDAKADPLREMAERLAKRER